jgi:hypothetical protein
MSNEKREFLEKHYKIIDNDDCFEELIEELKDNESVI